jgi:hypothetical protein
MCRQGPKLPEPLLVLGKLERLVAVDVKFCDRLPELAIGFVNAALAILV